MAKISVIIPVYNAEKYIKKSLTSLMTQTLDDIEFIIINDGSTDSSMIIIEEVINNYPERKPNTILVNRENKGVSATRSEGLALSNGEYIIHADGDDWVESDMLESLYLEAISSLADIVICDYYINSEEIQLYVTQEIGSTNLECIKKILLGELHGSSWNKLIKRSLISENNIDYIDNIDYLEDVVFNVKSLYYAKSISHLKKAFYHYNISNNHSITSFINEIKIDHVIKATSLVSDFLSSKKLNNIKENELNIFKLNQKSWFILSNRKSVSKKILNLYPESNNKIFKTKHKIHMKLILISSGYKLHYLSQMLLKILNFMYFILKGK